MLGRVNEKVANYNSMTKIQQLQAAYQRNAEESIRYMDEIHLFIVEIGRRLRDYLGCENRNIEYLDAYNARKSHPQGTGKIGNNGRLEFNILVLASHERININSYGKYLFDNDVSHVSGAILNLEVSLSENGFLVVGPDLTSPATSTEFLLNTMNNDNWDGFLDACWQYIEGVISKGIIDRLHTISEQLTGIPKSRIGFRISEE